MVKKKTPKFQTTQKMRDDFGLCINKGIRIYPIAIQNKKGLYLVEVDFKGKKNISKDSDKKEIEYDENDAWEMIFKYYSHYAEKN